MVSKISTLRGETLHNVGWREVGKLMFLALEYLHATITSSPSSLSAILKTDILTVTSTGIFTFSADFLYMYI